MSISSTGGARALLFERLVDEDPRARAEQRPLRTHDARGLQASVLRRLSLLLNTRAVRPRPARDELTVLDYGLPDYSSLYTLDPRAHVALAAEIRRTVEAFEPRLLVVDVAVERIESRERTLSVALTGRLRSETTTEPVTFLIPLSGDESAEERP